MFCSKIDIIALSSRIFFLTLRNKKKNEKMNVLVSYEIEKKGRRNGRRGGKRNLHFEVCVCACLWDGQRKTDDYLENSCSMQSYNVFILTFSYLSMFAFLHMCDNIYLWKQKTNLWALGIKLRFSDLRANLFTNVQREHVWTVMLFTQKANWKSMDK